VDWLIEPREYRSGVLVARTLLSPDGGHAFVRAINCGPTTCTVPEGELVATAEVVESQDISEERHTGHESERYDHVKCLIICRIV
jgi:hypothetical protein